MRSAAGGSSRPPRLPLSQLSPAPLTTTSGCPDPTCALWISGGQGGIVSAWSPDRLNGTAFSRGSPSPPRPGDPGVRGEGYMKITTAGHLAQVHTFVGGGILGWRGRRGQGAFAGPERAQALLRPSACPGRRRPRWPAGPPPTAHREADPAHPEAAAGARLSAEGRGRPLVVEPLRYSSLPLSTPPHCPPHSSSQRGTHPGPQQPPARPTPHPRSLLRSRPYAAAKGVF
ncbi:collagen alpha-1(X) chain-like [Cervus elaphus]|uniref:collagen alpha-1(X) chain-like n=1 Tax=Cervus elaphus TaxID=9860 RepID=UPI001CC324E7|nr:collagen alpha-1(X) chain-like [Cervus elaphus]XP_043763122.1 collagen alpha-1(X) chain-like [Cervus elaphus]XP_043763123.1 collagen alpha-1(X) chain-like [Cervus elaphus]XP_043763124.1 collagen alpha-1(X) chain-like [Cervus elaphus]